jgi:hypothetical protein
MIHRYLSNISFKALLFSLFWIICSNGFAQEEIKNPAIWGAKIHRGYIWAHSREVIDISNSNPTGFQVEWSRVNLSKKAWERCNCYSKTGLSFNYFDYQNPQVLGNSYNLIAFAEPYLNLNNRLFYTLRGGLGITYLNKIYDEDSNPENLFFSSPVSFIGLVNVSINYKLSPKWSFNFTGHYNHISNGGMKKPNKGMNFPTLSLGADYSPSSFTLPFREKITLKKGKINGYTRLFATRPDVPATDELPAGRAWLLGISGGALLRVANFNALNLGVEVIRDNSLKEEGLRKDIDKDHHIIAIAAGHHLIFGQFDFNQQMAYYLYKPFPFTENKFYQRYELAYQLNEYLLAGISLKVHGHVAENFDVRIGYLF